MHAGTEGMGAASLNYPAALHGDGSWVCIKMSWQRRLDISLNCL